jgi:hypothetical protein
MVVLSGLAIKKGALLTRPLLSISLLLYLKTPGNDAVRGIIGGDAHLNAIAFHHPDLSLLHPAAEYPPHDGTIVAFYLQGSPAHNLCHHPFQFNQVISAHQASFEVLFFSRIVLSKFYHTKTILTSKNKAFSVISLAL